MEDVSRAVMTFLVNAAWQVPLFALVAIGCDCLLRRAPARYRHHMWTLALGLSLALPLWSVRTIVAADGAPPMVLGNEAGQQAANLGAIDYLTFAPGMMPPGSIHVPPLLLYVTVMGYVAFLLVRTSRLWLGWRHTTTILASAFERNPEPLMDSVDERCRRVLGSDRVPILCSGEIGGPLTIGAFKPVVVLPAQAFAVTSPEMLGSILGHELAHVQRRDFIRNLATEVLYTPIAFHPAARWIKRGIDATRELACDELVTEALVPRSAYARSLVHVAASMQSTGGAGYSLGILEAGNLEQRIRTLSQPRLRLRVRVARAALAAAAAAMVAAGTTASAFSVSASQVLTAADAERQLVGTWRARWEDVLVPKFTASTDSSPIWLQFRIEGGRVVGTAWHDGIDLLDQAGTDVKILQVFPKNATAPLQDIITTGQMVSFKELHHGEVVEYQLDILEEQRAVLRLKDSRGLDGGQQFHEWLTLTRQ